MSSDGGRVRRENENDYENENDLEDGLLALAATFGGGGVGLLVLAATAEETESACWRSPLRFGVGLLALAATSEGKEVGYEAVSLRAQTGEVTRMSSLQSTARMSERAESSR